MQRGAFLGVAAVLLLLEPTKVLGIQAVAGDVQTLGQAPLDTSWIPPLLESMKSIGVQPTTAKKITDAAKTFYMRTEELNAALAAKQPTATYQAKAACKSGERHFQGLMNLVADRMNRFQRFLKPKQLAALRLAMKNNIAMVNRVTQPVVKAQFMAVGAEATILIAKAVVMQIAPRFLWRVDVVLGPFLPPIQAAAKAAALAAEKEQVVGVAQVKFQQQSAFDLSQPPSTATRYPSGLPSASLGVINPQYVKVNGVQMIWCQVCNHLITMGQWLEALVPVNRGSLKIARGATFLDMDSRLMALAAANSTRASFVVCPSTVSPIVTTTAAAIGWRRR